MLTAMGKSLQGNGNVVEIETGILKTQTFSLGNWRCTSFVIIYAS